MDHAYRFINPTPRGLLEDTKDEWNSPLPTLKSPDIPGRTRRLPTGSYLSYGYVVPRPMPPDQTHVNDVGDRWLRRTVEDFRL